MGIFERKLLEKRYGYKGGKLQDLMTQIIRENQGRIAHAVTTTDKRRFEKNVKALAPKSDKGKKIIIPDVSNVIRRSPTIIKAADKGALMAETLRDRLRKDIKQVMLDEGITTTRGTVKRSIARKVEKQIGETFAGYTARNPEFGGVPTNLHAIAVTETRAVINNVRKEYVQAVAKESGREVMKTWVHNDSLSKTPRPGHERLHGTTIPMHKRFVLKGAKRTYRVDGPHDERLPADEAIQCACELSFAFTGEE